MTFATAADRPRSAWQRIAAWVFVVLTAIAVTGSVIGFWVNRTVLDTDGFMAAVTPIVESESVQAVVSDRVSDQVIEALDIETRLTDRLTQAEQQLIDRFAEALDLPDAIVSRLQGSRLGLEQLAPVVAAGVESRIRDLVDRFVSSPAGQQLLLRTIEVAHDRSVLLLRDDLDQLPNVVVTEGEVRLTFVPIVAEVLRSLVNSGLEILSIQREIPEFDSAEDATAAVQRLAGIVGRDLPADFGQVRITSEASLERAQGLLRAFDIALWVLLILAIAFGALAVWLAPSTSAGVIRVGVAMGIGGMLGWGIVQIVGAQVVDAATTADGRVALGDVVSSLVNGLSGSAFALAVIGLGLIIAGFVADRPLRPAAVSVGDGPATPAAVAPIPEPAATAQVPAAAPETQSTTKAPTAKTTAATKPAVKEPAATKPAATEPAATKPPAKKAAAKPSAKKPPAKKAAAKPATPSTTRRRRRPPATGA